MAKKEDPKPPTVAGTGGVEAPERAEHNPYFEPRVVIIPELESLCEDAIRWMRRNDYAAVYDVERLLLERAEGRRGYRGRAKLYGIEADLKQGVFSKDGVHIDDRFEEVLPDLEFHFPATLARALRLWAESLETRDAQAARQKLRRAQHVEQTIDHRDRLMRARLENHTRFGLLEWDCLEPERARVHYESALPCVSAKTDPWNRGELLVLGALTHRTSDPYAAQTMLAEAIETFTNPEDQLRYDLARAHDRWGRAAGERDHVEQALAIYERINARHFAGAAKVWLSRGTSAARTVAASQAARPSRAILESFLPEGRRIGGDRYEDVVFQGYRWARLPGNDAFYIYGPTGAGKEAVAWALHAMGPRPKGPFVKLDAGRLNSEAESADLFGSVAGAFTDAKDKPSAFERAHKGTLFIDEIQNLKHDYQIKLLRILEQRVVCRIGGQKEIPFDIVLVVSANKELPELVANGEFREDLFYRIYQNVLCIPPLAERPEEIPTYAAGFIGEFRDEYGYQTCSLTLGALERLKSYPWPGNVRQLRNFCRSLINEAGDRYIDERDVADAMRRLHPRMAQEGGDGGDRDDLLWRLKKFELFIRSGGRTDLGAPLNEHLDALRDGCILAADEATRGNNAHTSRILGFQSKSTAKYHLERIRGGRSGGEDDRTEEAPAPNSRSKNAGN